MRETVEAIGGGLAPPLPTSPGNHRRREVLKDIELAVCKDRQQNYGDAEDNFADIAAHLTTHFRKKWGDKRVWFTPDDVAVICSYIKLSRLATSPTYLDNWTDLGGYAVCGAGIVVAGYDTPTTELQRGK